MVGHAYNPSPQEAEKETHSQFKPGHRVRIPSQNTEQSLPIPSPQNMLGKSVHNCKVSWKDDSCYL